jgi:hypothetical protein
MHFKRYTFSGKLQELIQRAEFGNSEDVDHIMSHLNSDSTFAMTRYVDYALSLVENKNGILQIEYYLFNGTLIQRNYCCLFFNRRGDWDLVNKAFKQGLIDEIQTFSR